jgi:uncharacterized protein YndB with AHSA1/START domain
MAVHVEVEIEVARPLGEVFSYLADARNLPHWTDGFATVEQLSSGPIGLGTTFRYRTLRPAASSELRWIEFERDHKLAWDGRPAGPGAPTLAGSYQLEATAGGSRLLGIFTPEIGGAMRLLAPLVTRSLRKRCEADLARLKELLERDERDGSDPRAGR